ncbi:MAG: hypothetical protein K2X82_25595 [Gemmataceae bacterium]|nr:hypothetical protein [Gemmataceae bacterium]
MAGELTFVTAVEAGGIERRAIRMVDSLRTFGGLLADAPVVFVIPRPGPPLSRETLRQVDAYQITLLRARPAVKYGWYNFLNKVVSFCHAELVAQTAFVCWIDDDFLVLDDLPLLRLGHEYDFAACPCDLNMGSTGPGGRFEEYWAEYCRVAGTDFARLGWVRTHRERAAARTYYNSGLVCYRRSTGFAAEYSRIVNAVLDGRLTSSTEGIYMHEQMALGAAARQLGLRALDLPWEYNLSSNDIYASRHNNVRAVHYHDSLSPARYDRFVPALTAVRPDRTGYLSAIAPIDPKDFGLISRLRMKLTRVWRTRQQQRYVRTCRVIDTPVK